MKFEHLRKSGQICAIFRGMEEEDPESQMAALAEASQIALDKQDFGVAVAAMTTSCSL